ncbi:MAG: hypothetical protein HKO66_16810 [Saprospiraceae bacterium]|nr:hypothetical protein [Bacteroidia bacterium]NNE14674.1 hypothetical protein [Saprospiraceae bacterium]NNL93907.1 hypothetical protein [Saprospiraceae bacterium]
MPKKSKKQDTAKVHDELKGFDIKINPFGELQSNFNIDKINDFLNENVENAKIPDKTEEE